MMRVSVLTTGLAGALFGLVIGILAPDGRWGPIAMLIGISAALLLATRASGPRDCRHLHLLVMLGFALHAASATLLLQWSEVNGRGGFITGDDGAYAYLSWGFVEYLRGRPIAPLVPPMWAGEAYLFGTWVYLESALFFVFGPDPLVPIFMNGGFAVGLALLTGDLVRRLFGRPSAELSAWLVVAWPSLLAWSSLNLKDALALFLVGTSLWAVVRFAERPRWSLLVLAFAVLLPLESLRRYLFVGMAPLIATAVWLTPWRDIRERLRWGVPATGVAITLLLTAQAGVTLGPGLIATFEATREAMAVDARTAFAERPAHLVAVGDTFRVPTRTGDEDPVRVVPVPANARIVVITSGLTPPPAAPGTVQVRPGDLVVVGPPGTTPAPTDRWTELRSEGGTTRLAPVSEPGAEPTFVRTIAHLPRGLAYALFAPFPWSAERTLDIFAIAEMVLWYVVLGAAVATCWSHRRRWAILAPMILYVLGLIFLFSLVEGNVGTLFRHRAMVIPVTIGLASPTLVAVRSRLFGWSWQRRAA